MNPLVLIPARGGSKGILQKNIKSLKGKPLIQYTIEAARELFEDENICISTDDLDIKTIVENSGLKVPFIRPSELSTDYSSMEEVMIHAIDHYQNKGVFFEKIVK